MEKCKVSELCGGCSYQGLPYKRQLEIKQEKVNKLLANFHRVEDIIGMSDPYHYRNKVQVSFGKIGNRILVGNYVPSTHQIVECDECQISDEIAYKIINSIKRLVIKYHISIFDENVYKGCMRHILIRTSSLNQYMVVLVTGSININKKDLFISDLLKYNPEITTIVQNINNQRTSMILADKNITIYGKGYIEDKLCDRYFKISPNSFYQVNKRQTEILYKTALNLAQLKKNELIIDAYCGTGTIGIIASDRVAKVLGVELNSRAIKDALSNLKRNKIDNVEFICEDAGKYMEYLSKQKIQIDTVIMDPPRAGSDYKFMNSMVKLRPKKILYISCNPVTLKDNLNYLSKFYKVEKIQPVDMFPFSEHVETVVQLSKGDIDRGKF